MIRVLDAGCRTPADGSTRKTRQATPMDIKTDQSPVMEAAIAEECLVLMKSALDRRGITFWLSWGTCLGAIRERGFIAHDYDVDLGIDARDRRRFLSLIPELESRQFRAQFPFGKQGVKLIRRDVHIDVFFFKYLGPHGLRKWSTHGVDLGEDFFSRLDTIEFLGVTYNVPRDPAEYLRHAYGDDWATPKPFPWGDEGIEASVACGRSHRHNLATIKRSFDRQGIRFCLLERSCREALVVDDGDGGEEGPPGGITLGVGVADQPRVLDAVGRMEGEGFTVVRASHLPASTTHLRREGEPIRVKYMWRRGLADQIKGCRWSCGYDRLWGDYFSQFEAVPFLGEMYPVPRDPGRYLDEVYGKGYWTRPGFGRLSGPELADLPGRMLAEGLPVEVVAKEPWIPYLHDHDNLLIPYGDTLVVGAIEGPIRPGMIVLARHADRIAVRWVDSVDPRDGVRLSDLRKPADGWTPASAVLGHVTALRRRRSGLTIPLGSRPSATCFKILQPLIRLFK